MSSRYNLMKQSDVAKDATDEQPWPDPLTIKYSSFIYNDPPTYFEVDDTFLQYPYMACHALYGTTDNEDMVLSINNVPHISLLELDSVIKFPSNSDILRFNSRSV